MSFESSTIASLAIDPIFASHRVRQPQMRPAYGGSGSVGRDLDAAAGWLSRALGVALLSLCLALAFGLLTWSSADPSFAKGATGSLRNWLGPIGAVVSDLIMQTLGLAGVLALLPPVYWSLELLTRPTMPKLRSRMLIAPFAILCLASAFSSLPRVSLWPLQSGFGGLLGDFGISMLSSVLATLNADRAGLAAGVLFLVLGLGLLMAALGVSVAELTAAVKPAAKGHQPDTSWVSRLKYATPLPAILANEAVADALDASLETVSGFAHETSAARPAHTIIAPAVAVGLAVPRVPLPTITVRPPPAQVSMPERAPAPHVVTRQPSAPRYQLPPLSLLPRSSQPRQSPTLHHAADTHMADRLTAVLVGFGIQGVMRTHISGPFVTTYTFDPAAGTRPTRIMALADDIARGLGSRGVRVQLAAGRSSIMIEIPHRDPITLGLRDLVDQPGFTAPDVRLPLALGSSAAGDAVIADLADLPHLLLAGADARRRTEVLNSMTTSLVYRWTPDRLRLMLIDPASSCFAPFRRSPHLEGAAIAQGAGTLAALSWMAAEIERRLEHLQNFGGVRTLEAYNMQVLSDTSRQASNQPLAPMPYHVVAISDLAAITLAAGDNARLEETLKRVLWRGRSVGVHVLAATGRVDDAALPAWVKTAFTTRLALALPTKSESRAVLADVGAEDLCDDGDMLLTTPSESLRRGAGGGLLPRLLAASLTAAATEAVANACAAPAPGLRSQPDRVVSVIIPAVAPIAAARAPLYHSVTPPDAWKIHTRQNSGGQSLGGQTPETLLYDRAVGLVLRERIADADFLRRPLGISYAAALDLIEQMTRDGLVSALDADGNRSVLVGCA